MGMWEWLGAGGTGKRRTKAKKQPVLSAVETHAAVHTVTPRMSSGWECLRPAVWPQAHLLQGEDRCIMSKFTSESLS